VGDRSPGEGSVQELIKTHRLEKKVRMTGRLSKEELFEYQSIADAGIDLRTHTQGPLTGRLREAFEPEKVYNMTGHVKPAYMEGQERLKPRNSYLENKIINRIFWLYNNPGHLCRMGITGYRVDAKVPKLNDAVISGYCEALGL